LGNESVPQVEREAVVGATQTGDEMVLECSDGSLCGVGSVHVWRYQLKVDTLIL
jgi:hypothetical protein